MNPPPPPPAYAYEEQPGVEPLDTKEYTLSYKELTMSGGVHQRVSSPHQDTVAFGPSASAAQFGNRPQRPTNVLLLPAEEADPPQALTELESWRRYLGTIHLQPIGLAASHADAIRRVWWLLEWMVGRPLRAPVAGPGGDLGFQMSWSTEGFYLDLDIAEDGTFEWFFKDRGTGVIEGSEDDRHAIPPESLVRRLVACCLT